MVGDLGNFVGQDLRKQFMYGPQKLAEGDSVAEEIAFETVSFTDDITGETKTFQFNPETHHPPDSTGRMRRKGINVSDVATTGGTTFFDTAELVKEAAAPAGPAAPKKEKRPIPINPETDADAEALEEQRDQLFRPLKHGYASPKGALIDYKISQYTDPLVRIASRGMINPDIDDRLRRYMGEKPDRYVRSYEGRPEDFGKLVLDPRDQTLGLDKETIDRELAEQRKFSGLEDDERFDDDQVKDLLWRARERNRNPMWRRQIEKGGMKTSDDPVDDKTNAAKKADTARAPELDWGVRKSGTSGGLSAALKAKGESPLVTDVEGPEKGTGRSEEEYDKIIWDAFGDPVNKAIAKTEEKEVAEELISRSGKDAEEEAGDAKSKGDFQATATDRGLLETESEEKDGRSREVSDLNTLQKGAALIALASRNPSMARKLMGQTQYRDDGTRIAPGQGRRSSRSIIDTGIAPPPISQDPTWGERMGDIIAAQDPRKYAGPSRAQLQLAEDAYHEDHPDEETIDWTDETIDIGSPFRQGGPVRLARGGGLSSLQPPINPGDFVIASVVVSGLGDGSSEFGVQRLTDELGVQPRPFTAALGGEVRGPGSGLDDLIQTSVRGKQAARLANQEFVVPRQDVMKIGKGSLKNGQEMLYALMDRVRKQKSGGQQPPRLQGSLAGLMGNMRS